MDTSTGGAGNMAIKNKAKDLKDKAKEKKEFLDKAESIINSAKTISDLRDVLIEIIKVIRPKKETE